jgi:hypothetical protein
MDSQKVGAGAALMAALTFIIGFALLFTVLIPAGYFAADTDALQNAAFIASHQTMLAVWYLIIYILFGVALVVTVLALHERLGAGSATARVASAFGVIWAGLVIASGMIANVGGSVIADLYLSDPEQAAALWLTLDIIVRGLGGGNEIVGGVWILLTSLAALKARSLPGLLNTLGAIVGTAGILTTVPALAGLELLGMIFGLGSVVWFIWLGVHMLRRPAGQTTKHYSPIKSL